VVPSIIERVNLNSLEILPHIDIKYRLDDERQVRFNNSLTYIMPKFRELTEFEYTEIFAGTKIRGNSDLVNSKSLNTDISYENYFNGGEYVMVNVFNKYIINPIERINVATSSGRLETFQNSRSAIVSGVEFEIKKKYKNISFDYNLSVLRSKILIDDNLGSSIIVTNSNRPLQGSTPILSNLDIFYELNQKQSLGITTNYIGKKLNSVGIQGLGDIYQEDQLLLNLVYNLKLDKITLRLKGQNILNTSFQLNQQTDDGQKVVNEYLIPRGINFSLSFAF
jgi:outer membrane receptor protein involved in Fe transport